MLQDDSDTIDRAAGGASPILVIGSYNQDITLRVPNFPRPGETILAQGVEPSHGGKGSNQAVQAARFGSKVILFAAVGQDESGQSARSFWASEGVTASSCFVAENEATGSATILVDEQGENIIIVQAGANTCLDAELVVRKLLSLDDTPALVVGQLETPVEATYGAFERAGKLGITTLLNAAPLSSPLPQAVLDVTDILAVNEIEAQALVPGTITSNDPVTAARQLSEVVSLGVVMTCGSEGAKLFQAGSETLSVAAPPVKVRDTTGAGDSFIGAFASEYVRSGSLVDAMEWAAAAGSFACSRFGAVPAYGTRAEVLHLFPHLA